jgi:hypothetical protein
MEYLCAGCLGGVVSPRTARCCQLLPWQRFSLDCDQVCRLDRERDLRWNPTQARYFRLRLLRLHFRYRLWCFLRRQVRLQQRAGMWLARGLMAHRTPSHLKEQVVAVRLYCCAWWYAGAVGAVEGLHRSARQQRLPAQQSARSKVATWTKTKNKYIPEAGSIEKAVTDCTRCAEHSVDDQPAQAPDAAPMFQRANNSAVIRMRAAAARARTFCTWHGLILFPFPSKKCHFP